MQIKDLSAGDRFVIRDNPDIRGEVLLIDPLVAQVKLDNVTYEGYQWTVLSSKTEVLEEVESLAN